jgi:hypothetical protein
MGGGGGSKKFGQYREGDKAYICSKGRRKVFLVSFVSLSVVFSRKGNKLKEVHAFLLSSYIDPTLPPPLTTHLQNGRLTTHSLSLSSLYIGDRGLPMPSERKGKSKEDDSKKAWASYDVFSLRFNLCSSKTEELKLFPHTVILFCNFFILNSASPRFFYFILVSKKKFSDGYKEFFASVEPNAHKTFEKTENL